MLSPWRSWSDGEPARRERWPADVARRARASPVSGGSWFAERAQAHVASRVFLRLCVADGCGGGALQANRNTRVFGQRRFLRGVPTTIEEKPSMGGRP